MSIRIPQQRHRLHWWLQRHSFEQNNVHHYENEEKLVSLRDLPQEQNLPHNPTFHQFLATTSTIDGGEKLTFMSLQRMTPTRAAFRREALQWTCCGIRCDCLKCYWRLQRATIRISLRHEIEGTSQITDHDHFLFIWSRAFCSEVITNFPPKSNREQNLRKYMQVEGHNILPKLFK